MLLHFLRQCKAGDYPGDCGTVKWQDWPSRGVGGAGQAASRAFLESLRLQERVLVCWSLLGPKIFWSCCREKSILTVETVSLNFQLSVAFVITIIIIHNGLTQRILSLCLTVKLKCLCP